MHLQKLISQRRKSVYRGYGDVTLAAIASLLPVIGITFTLLFIVYHYRLAPSQIPVEDLRRTNTSNYEPGFFYIEFSATRLTTVASWASSVALVLPGAFMSLHWHRITSFMQENALKGNSMAMPTPYEYSLLLALRTGGLPSLWEWIKNYYLRRKQRRLSLLSDAGKTLTMILVLGYVPCDCIQKPHCSQLTEFSLASLTRYSM